MRIIDISKQFIRVNEREDLIWFAGFIISGFILKALFSGILSRQFFKFFKRFSDAKDVEVFVKLLKKPFEYFIVILLFILAFDRLTVPSDWALKIGKSRIHFDDLFINFGKTAITLSVLWILLRCTDFIGYIFMQRSKKEGDANDAQLAKFLKDIIKVFILISGILFLLGSVFGLNVTSIITGLGIGGLAIALAAQETIANLIGSFVIFLDKPFAVGDIIESEKIKGTVESVGFRSTRIRTPDKTLLTVPNKKLVDSALNNLTRTGIRRVKSMISLSVTSSGEKLKTLIREIEGELQNHPDTNENSQVILSDITEHAIIISIIYFVMSNDLDYTAHVKQDINFKILEKVEKSQLQLVSIETIIRNE
ncbi:MAG: mechanosensitive ion channel family protein [Bacteroidetes bacterium]|nr:mechanosensitive ion channel family protein [Bacteroidota bacterium]